MSSTFALSLLSIVWKRIFLFFWTILTSKRKATNNRVVLPLEEKKLVDLTFPVATLILKGTNITERRHNHKTKSNSSLDFNSFFFFWNMKFHPCLFTFFCQLRIRKGVTVNLICSETFSGFPQMSGNFFALFALIHKNTSKKKELILQWKSPNKLTHFKTF